MPWVLPHPIQVRDETKGGRTMTKKDRFLTHGSGLVGLVMVVVLLTGAAPPPTKDRVPTAHSDKAKALHAPFGDARTASGEVVAAGKTLYEGKGTCVLCHGIGGRGDGPA